MQMREDETAIKEGLSLAIAVREQYMHQAHWIIEHDDEHIEHFEEWSRRVVESIEALVPRIPQPEQHRLQQVKADCEALNILFREKIMPAVDRDDRELIVTYHLEAQAITERAAMQADTVARIAEQQMAHAHVVATDATEIGIITGAVCVLLVVLLSIGFTMRLKELVLNPLGVLTDAARRFGGGDFASRVGNVGKGELLAVSRAFDRMANQLETHEKKLVRMERMAAIGQLAAGMAHEINNPIAIIRGYLKTMHTETSIETLQDELRILDEEAAVCQQLVEDLLTYSRIPQLECLNVDIASLLEDSASRFLETPAGDAVSLVVNCENGQAYADPARIRQVIVNLLLNASQASQGGGTVEVHGSIIPNGGYQFSIEDDGPGIDPNDLEKLFEPFFTSRAGGSGLGLAVCQGIVHGHGGTIQVENVQPTGARFTVSLPGVIRQEEIG